MSFLSHAPPLGGLSPHHGAFQEYAAHTLDLSKVLSSKGSMGTCIPKGVTTFVHTASRRTERRLEAVACKRLILIEAPSPADQRGMLRVATTLVTNKEETSMRFYTTPHPFLLWYRSPRPH